MCDLKPLTTETGYESIVVEPGTLAAIANGEPIVLMGKTYLPASGVSTDEVR